MKAIRSQPALAPRRVCITFQPWQPWLRHVMYGIRQYIQEQALSWNLLFTHYVEAVSPRQLNLREVDGVITGAIETRIPALNDRPNVMVEEHRMTDRQVPLVGTDMYAVGKLAAEHLIERGFGSFAAVTIHHEHPAARRRIEGFCHTIEQLGFHAPVFRTTPSRRRGRREFEDQLTDLAKFLHALPRPVGLFIMDVNQTWRAALACQHAHLRVPDDVAMICGGNDDILFDNLRPSISGILYDSVHVGYEAARVLDHLMNDRPVSPRILIPPLRPIVRQSSDFLAIKDPDVHAAVQYIWRHVAQSPTVETVAEHVLVSPRTLLRKFRLVMNSGPAAEIHRAKVETAKHLLMTTELSLIHVAMDSGFLSQAQLCHHIKQDTGMTPTQLRSRHRPFAGDFIA